MSTRRIPSFTYKTFGVFLLAASIQASFEIAAGDDADLTSFVSRPEIRVPILNVTKYQPESVSRGYFFTAPYARIFQKKFSSSYYQPCQTGPQIYDDEGNLVWTGACEFSNKNAADVRPVLIDGEWRISGIHLGLGEDDIYQYGTGNRVGYGYVLDATYSEQFKVQMPKDIETFNMHEFKILETTKTALSILYQPKYVDVSAVEGADKEAGWVANMGFRETELATGDTEFEWWALDHVNLTESTKEPEDLNEELPSSWNFFHINSVDKSSNGNYLISSQNTNTIYCISGEDGSIVWRLGGKQSDFEFEDFDFGRQHDARFLETNGLDTVSDESTSTYISLFNNGGDGLEDGTQTSEVQIIALNLQDRTADLVRAIPRPDDEITSFGGNSHFLPNGNLFASWADNAYATEHASDDSIVMEARFLSDRFRIYRMFKSDFKGLPSEPIALKCNTYGTALKFSTTVCWISWNGATEVDSWRFSSAEETSLDTASGETKEVMGTVSKAGFETRFQKEGFYATVFAEALGRNGEVLGTSSIIATAVI